MIIGVPREVLPGERRVAVTPETVKKLQKLGFSILVERGAGDGSNFSDTTYEAAGAELAPDAESLYARAELVLKVRPPMQNELLQTHEADMLREGAALISFFFPAQNAALIERLSARKATVLAMDCVPRISRAQKMDALSSMANISGYRAIIEAANAFGRSLLGQITAAGKVPPAKVLIIGAGVAGLAAVGVARGLGAIVRAFDTRPAVREQVQSMGAEFLEVDIHEDGEGQGGYAKVMSEAFIKAELALFAEQAREVDIIVTTAQIPGKRAPVLITRDMVESMRPGSVIVDLAAEQGGNCELTRPGEAVQHNGVHIIGYTDLPSRLPSTSSQLYANNLVHLIQDMVGSDQVFRIDLGDEVVRGALILHEGELMWPAPPVQVAVPALVKQPPKPVIVAGHGGAVEKKGTHPAVMVGAAAFLALIGLTAPPEFLTHFTVFVLSCFIGWQVVWNVTPALHTPLMSVTNAISGIIILGGMLQFSGQAGWIQLALGGIAVLIAAINIVGGFMVTQRMLGMFHK